ncbi:MAG: MMPL family transporter, partial [Ktedonobacteraceae bacterium]
MQFLDLFLKTQVKKPDIRLLGSPFRRQCGNNDLPMRNAYGQLVYRFRWGLIAFWLVLLLGCIPFALLAPNTLTSGGYVSSGSETSQVADALITRLHQPASTLFVMFESSTAHVSDPAYQQQLQRVLQWGRAQAQVSMVSASVGNDQHTAAVLVGFQHNDSAIVGRIPSLRDQLAALPAGPAHLSLTGNAAINSALQAATEADGRQAELIALPLILCIFLLVFRSVIASCLPIALAIITICGACATLYGLA